MIALATSAEGAGVDSAETAETAERWLRQVLLQALGIVTQQQCTPAASVHDACVADARESCMFLEMSACSFGAGATKPCATEIQSNAVAAMYARSIELTAEVSYQRNGRMRCDSPLRVVWCGSALSLAPSDRLTNSRQKSWRRAKAEARALFSAEKQKL
jgi:hypothetical protein